MQYTKEQKRIITHNHGCGIVAAGPGSAKTSTLIEFTFKRLKKRGFKDRILVLTFSKSTQLDFRYRLAQHIKNTTPVNVKTFHSFGRSIIDQFYIELGFTQKPKLIKGKKPTAYKLKHNKITYDDMLTLPLQLFKEYPNLSATITEPYAYFLVDELQDINQQEAILIKVLASHIPTSLLVGDLKQSIYGFRGAGAEHWHYLEKRLKPKRYTLFKSFRLPKGSLPFVNEVADLFCNDPPLTSDDGNNRKPIFRQCETPDAQADYLAREIIKLGKRGIAPFDIAVLSRYKVQLQQLKLALKSRGISTIEYDCHEALEYAFAMLRALLRVTRWTINNLQSPAPINSIQKLMELVSIPKKYQATTLRNIAERGIRALKRKKPKTRKGESTYRQRLEVRKAILRAATYSDPVAGTQLLIAELLPYIKAKYESDWQRVQRDLCQAKASLRDLSWEQIDITLIRPIIQDAGVTLSTVHSAKGKEWKVVFLANVVKGEFPGKYSKQNEDDELRIFYTAITRHSYRLYLLQTPVNDILFTNKGMVHRELKTQSPFITPHLKLLNTSQLRNHSLLAIDKWGGI